MKKYFKKGYVKNTVSIFNVKSIWFFRGGYFLLTDKVFEQILCCSLHWSQRQIPKLGILSFPEFFNQSDIFCWQKTLKNKQTRLVKLIKFVKFSIHRFGIGRNFDEFTRKVYNKKMKLDRFDEIFAIVPFPFHWFLERSPFVPWRCSLDRLPLGYQRHPPNH